MTAMLTSDRRLSFAIGCLLVFSVPAGAERRPARAAAAPATVAGSDRATGAVAIVAGAPVPVSLYRMHLKNGVDALGLDAATEEGRRKIAALQRHVLSELIDRTLIEAEARRRMIAPSEADIAERRGIWIQRLGGEARYRAHLAEHDVAESNFDRLVVQELAAERLRADLTAGVAVSEPEVRGFYARGRRSGSAGELFRVPEQVTASHVLISARPQVIERQIRAGQGLDGDELASAIRAEMHARLRRAEWVRGQALEGNDFAALARRWSDDPGSRMRGGDLGTFARNTHPRAFDDAAFALPVGRISEVVQTDYGFHVIKLTARTAARIRTLDELRPSIRERLLTRKQTQRLRRWLESERERATIRIDPALRDAQHEPRRRDTAGSSTGVAAAFRSRP